MIRKMVVKKKENPSTWLSKKKDFTLVEQTDNSVTFAIEDDEEIV